MQCYDVDNTDNNELAKKYYGVQAATIKKDADAQWSIWHEYGEQFINCNDGFESMCEPICIASGIIWFPCDVKWVDNGKNPSPYKGFQV